MHLTHTPAFFSGVDVQEAEEDCLTDATTPTSFEPITQSQISTLELDELAPEEVTASQEEVSPVDQDTSPAAEVSPPEEEASPAEDVRPPEEEAKEAEADSSKEERDSEKREEPEGDTDSSSQSVDELLADWREDLEAFQQMEKDELWQSSGASCPVTAVWALCGGRNLEGNASSQVTSVNVVNSKGSWGVHDC